MWPRRDTTERVGERERVDEEGVVGGRGWFLFFIHLLASEPTHNIDDLIRCCCVLCVVS